MSLMSEMQSVPFEQAWNKPRPITNTLVNQKLQDAETKFADTNDCLDFWGVNERSL